MPIEQKTLQIYVKGERTFNMTFFPKELETLVLEHFSKNFPEIVNKFTIEFEHENDGSITIQGWQEIKE